MPRSNCQSLLILAAVATMIGVAATSGSAQTVADQQVQAAVASSPEPTKGPSPSVKTVVRNGVTVTEPITLPSPVDVVVQPPSPAKPLPKKGAATGEGRKAGQLRRKPALRPSKSEPPGSPPAPKRP